MAALRVGQTGPGGTIIGPVGGAVRGGVVALLLVLGSACSRTPVEVLVDVEEGHQSVILAVQVDSSTTSFDVRAAEIVGGQLSVPIIVREVHDASHSVSITALLYTDSLEDLEIETGRLTSVEGSDRPPRLIPKPDSAYAVTVRGAEVGTWFPQDGVPDFLADFRLPPRDPLASCVQFDRETITLGPGDTASFALALDDDTILVGTSGLAVYRFGRTGSIEMTVDPANKVIGAARDSRGQLWIGSSQGRLYTATATGSRLEMTPVFDLGDSDAFVWIDAGPVRGGSEAFTLSRTGRLRRLRTANQRVAPDPIYTFDAGPRWVTALGGVARVAPGEAVAVWPHTSRIVRVLETGPIEESPANGPATTVAVVPGVGTVIGTASGELWAHDQGQWTLLEKNDELQSISSIMPYGPGFAFTADSGMFGQYVTDGGVCPLQAPVGHYAQRIAPIGSGGVAVVGLTTIAGSRQIHATVLQPKAD